MTTDQNALADLLIDAMLSHVAEQGWRNLKLKDIAERAGLTHAQAYAVCPTRADLLNNYARRVDLAAVTGFDSVPDDAEARYDRLLDMLMQRFEAVDSDRMAVTSIVEDVMREPDTLLSLLPQRQKSFSFLAAAAGFPSRGMLGHFFAKVLSGV